ncbi:MAG: sulfatase-like hydrolase/transferase [Gammaproteobacteria bacterium]|nr:sulfatase-like hydrolase/transferase [Gammaproteobacteria bacterium]
MFSKKAAIYFLGALLLGFVAWTYYYVGMSNMNQLISTVVFGFSGLLSANIYFTLSLVKYLLIYPFVLTIFLLLIEKKYPFLQRVLPGALILIGLSGLSLQYDIPHFINALYAHQNPNQTDYFHEHFTDPSSIPFQTAHTPKSLILIYAESLESSYQNTSLFDHDLLTSLTELKQPFISFKHFKQTAGADWTMGGIVASQCGIPLKLTTLFNGNDIGSNISHFLPGAVCLSDILATLGYHNVFLKGASLRFSGIDTFLKTHHYHEMLGKHEWLKQGYHTHQMTAWGLPDDLLFQEAKLKLKQLINTQKPFNLTLLTVDTHGVNGLLNHACAASGGKNFEDIIECSAHQVADFIHYVDNQGWSDQVTIVVMGDHLAMKNAAYSKLTAGQPRYIFNMIISQEPLEKNRDTIFHVDLFPTILTALDITWPGDNKLALGYSALTPKTKNLSTSERFNTLEQITASESTHYNRLWMKPEKE